MADLSNVLGQGLQEIAHNKLQQLQNKSSPLPANNFIDALNQLLTPQQNSFANQFQLPSQIKPSEAKQLADISLKERKFEREKQEAEKKVKREEQEAINKQTEPYYQERLKQSNAAKEGIKRLNRMKHLIEHGSLPFSSYYNLLNDLEKTGAPSSSKAPKTFIGEIVNSITKPISTVLKSAQRGIFSTDTEEFEKLSNDFIRGAKSIFGSRITDKDLEAYMKSIPTLSQTDKGKLAVMRNMENLLRGEVIRTKALKQILKENKGERPKNLELLVEKKAKKRLDQLAERFEKGLPAKSKDGSKENNQKAELDKIKLSFGL